MLKRWIIKLYLVLLVFFLLLLGACAKHPQNKPPDLLDDNYDEEVEVYDPFESYNRLMFGFNDGLYNWVFFPIADAYGYIVPDFIETGLANFFHNLAFPVRAIGDIFQGNGEKLRRDTFFFVVNSTSSLGLLDLRSDEEKARDSEDISQSLAYHGVPSGAYLVLPFLGPSNVRNIFGMIGDVGLTPSTYLGSPDSTIVGFTKEVNKTSRSNPYLEITKGAVDPYSAIRDAYNKNFQKRLAE
ncbi:hypothetical protein EOM39_06310 [Candidatus Gracilibacteria bacterium]|nr:hypothetical protein [Candidatus Gracilibacteria bacterium]